MAKVENALEYGNREGHRLARNRQAAVDAIAADGDLSPEGRRRKLAEVETKYQQDIFALQSDVADLVQQDIERLQKSIALKRKGAADRRRMVLGDDLYADQLRRQVERSDYAGIASMLAGAVDHWEKHVIAGYALSTVRERMVDTPHDMTGAQLLADVEETVYGYSEVAAVEREIESLRRWDSSDVDIVRKVSETAARMGLREDSIREAIPVPDANAQQVWVNTPSGRVQMTRHDYERAAVAGENVTILAPVE